MHLKEFDEFEKDPSPETAMKLGCKILEMGIIT